MKVKKRTICFPIMNRVHYARQIKLLDLLQNNPQVDLQLVVGGTALLEKYERFFPALEEQGFSIHDTLYNVIEGGNHITMAKTAGLTALEFANSLQKLNPDIVLIRGDRFEQLAIAMVAAYLNKTIAHIEGGDVTGTIDESVRHAITKLSHIHFVTNEDARKRVIKMGENPAMVFNVGSPDVEFAASARQTSRDADAVNNIGMGHLIDIAKPFLMVMQHPVTTEANNREYMETLLEAVDSLDMQAVWFWPNSDAGTNEMAKAIRVYRETGKLKNNKIRFVTDLLPEDFLALLKKSSCLIGNSSAGIKESSYFGTPVVNIGTRQQGRLRGPNVRDVGYGRKEILAAVSAQLAHGAYDRSDIYFKPNTSKKIMQVLAAIPLQTQKKFYE